MKGKSKSVIIFSQKLSVIIYMAYMTHMSTEMKLEFSNSLLLYREIIIIVYKVE